MEAVDGSARNAWAVPDWEERAASLPPAPSRVRLLSPFDPILRGNGMQMVAPDYSELELPLDGDATRGALEQNTRCSPSVANTRAPWRARASANC